MLTLPPKIFYNPFVAGAGHGVPGRYCALRSYAEVSALKPGMDFRFPEYRREVFLRFYEFHLRHRAHPGCVYIYFPYLRSQFNWSLEQALWFAFINGNTQHCVTSWLIFKRFPDFKKVVKNTAPLERWFNAEYERLEFDVDRRYQKTEFINSVRCYARLTGGAQTQFFAAHTTLDDHTNFKSVWRAVRKDFHSFGRLSTFSYLEYLRIVGLPIECDELFLDDLQGSKSHRNGLAKVLGRDDLDWHRSNPTGFAGQYSPEILYWLSEEAALLLTTAKKRFAKQDFEHDVTYFTLESALCTYKSWHRPNRRYPGVYLDMFYNRIKKAESRWPAENLSLFWNARAQYLPTYLRLESTPTDPGLNAEKQNHYRETGQVIAMHHDWPCFVNHFNKKVGN